MSASPHPYAVLRRFLPVLLLVGSFVLVRDATAQNYVMTRAFDTINFQQPIGMQHAGDGTDRLYVIEQTGVIRVMEKVDSHWTKSTFLDIRAKVGAEIGPECGLLGLAFDPDFETNRYLYVNYTTKAPIRTVVERYRVRTDSNVVDTNDRLVILTFDQPYKSHNAGQLVFGPTDGMLYIATGDGGYDGYYGPDPENYGQRLNTLLGKILRIDVRNATEETPYVIPADNPFHHVDSARKEIYASGFRNPWRFSIDSISGRMWAGDVGDNDYEEINIVEKGKNYGWKKMEGRHCKPPGSVCDSTGLTMPIWEYAHTIGWSVTGGYVYRGERFPELVGEYLYADFGRGTIWGLRVDSAGVPTNRIIAETGRTITSFGLDRKNEIYMCVYDGQVYRLDLGAGVEIERGVATGISRITREPNPTSSTSLIRYTLDRATRVKLVVRDTRGSVVATLVDEQQSAGDHAARFDASELPGGVYYYTLDGGHGVAGGSIVVAK